jgi:hypothetical protein
MSVKKRSREDEMRLIEERTHSVTFQRTHVVKAPEINNALKLKRCPKMEAELATEKCNWVP